MRVKFTIRGKKKFTSALAKLKVAVFFFAICVRKDENNYILPNAIFLHILFKLHV